MFQQLNKWLSGGREWQFSGTIKIDGSSGRSKKRHEILALILSSAFKTLLLLFAILAFIADHSAESSAFVALFLYAVAVSAAWPSDHLAILLSGSS